MRRRPWMLVILAVLHILAPVGNLIVNAIWVRFPVWTYLQMGLQPENLARNWIGMFAPVLAGISIYICRRWSLFLYIVCMVTLFYASYRGYSERQSNLVFGELVFAALLDAFIIGYFLLPSVREVYLNPRLRWWETADRFHFDTACQFNVGNQVFEGQITNISNSGLFLKSETPPLDNAPVGLRFSHNGVVFNLLGTSILHGQQGRIGFGVKFVHDRASYRSVRVLTKMLLSEGRLLETRKPGEDDGFAAWLKTLLTSGKGIVPTIHKRG